MAWEEAVRSFAALRELVGRLDEDTVAALRAELEQVDERYRERKQTYFVVLGRRR
jgi:molybdopterin converting factor small subunit